MDAIEAILTRRSVRTFIDKPIAKDLINELLECAMSAPSAYNEQPWQFVVVDDKQKLNEVALIHPHAKMAPKAPLGILICADMRLTKIEGFWPQDCSAATQNLMIAAKAKEIGSVWTGIFPNEELVAVMQKLFKLPSEVIPFGFIVLGYTDSVISSVERFDESRIHFNEWK